MKKLLSVLALMLGAVVVSNGLAWAEPEVMPAAQPAQPATAPDAVAPTAGAPTAGEPATPEDELKYTFGSVVKVGTDEVTILEYNDEAEQEMEVVYKVSANTQYKNVNSLSELAANDSVEIFYEDTNGVKVITQIIKELADDTYDDMGNVSEDSGDLGTGDTNSSMTDTMTPEDTLQNTIEPPAQQ